MLLGESEDAINALTMIIETRLKSDNGEIILEIGLEGLKKWLFHPPFQETQT